MAGRRTAPSPQALVRAMLVLVGAIGTGYGGWLLISTQSPRQVIAVALWGLAAIIIHDALLAPALIAGGWLLTKYASVTVARVIIGTTAIVGPLLISAGAVLLRPDGAALNPTLNPRNYGMGLVIWSAAVCGCVMVWALLLNRQHRNRTRKAGYASHSGR